MSKNGKLRSITLLFALVASIVGGAFPAYADHGVPLANAGVDIAEVLSGAQVPIHVTVTNTGTTVDDVGALLGDEPNHDLDINWVRIRTQTFGHFTPVNAASDGWGSALQDLNQDNISDAADFTGGTIAPGGTATFTVVADAGAFASDRVANWTVRVSSDGGDSSGGASPAGVGALTTQIRVLNVESVAVMAPGGVLDGTATAGQDNLVVQSVIKNYGTSDLDVDPSLTSSNVNDSITDQGVRTIAAGDAVPVDFPVTLGTQTAARTFTGDAVATGANAIEDPSPQLTVQTPVALSYSVGTIQPKASVSGALQTFTMTIAKTNVPSLTFDKNNTVLSFLDSNGTTAFSTKLATPDGLGINNGTQLLTFEPVTIPGTPGSTALDGGYTPRLDVAATDGNGAAANRVVSNFAAGEFAIDNLVPFVAPSIAAPGGQVDPFNVPTAADGQTVTFSGPILKTFAGDPDTSAGVAECWLVIEDLAGNEISRSAATCNNNAGNLQGSAAVDSGNLDEARAVVEVVVADAAGNATAPTQSTSYVLIDNLDPAFVGGKTGCGPIGGTCDDTKTVRLNLSEHVLGSFENLDFTVDGEGPAGTGEIVVAATTAKCETPVIGKTFCKQVVLTLLNGNADEDWETSAAYALFDLLPERTSPTDGATNALPATPEIDIVDGIVPALPSLNTVSQDGIDAAGNAVSNARSAAGDGAFYTNQEAPNFTIGGVKVGYEGIVALDTNGVANFQAEAVGGTPADDVIAQCIAGGTTVECTPVGDLAGDGTYDVLVASRDGEGNLSEGTIAGSLVNASPVALVIDNVSPEGVSFADEAVGNALTVAIDEAIDFGRNSGADWIASDTSGGEEVGFDISSVTGSGDARLLNVDAAFTAADADLVYYTFVGAADKRYQDLAGNYLGDFTVPRA